MTEYIDKRKVEVMLENAQIISDGAYCGYCTEDVNLDKISVENTIKIQYAHWKYFHKQNIAVCTNCSFERNLDLNFGKAIACPNCGAYMDEKTIK